jgi:small nuclear ribonucleoprotein (snRNP)-like protein
VVLDLTKIDVSKADGFDNYLNAYLDDLGEINVERDTGCLYVHPEENTFRALYDMARYQEITFDDLRNTKNYPELKDHHRQTIQQMLDYYLNTVLSSFPEVTAKTLTT